jgi:hypothetical protein
MSFDLPASVERDLERYARAEHISPADAVVRLVQSGLESSKRKAEHKIKEADLKTLRENVPFFAFMEKLPDDVVEGMQASSKQFRAEEFIPRG